jgi:hypothetical protein
MTNRIDPAYEEIAAENWRDTLLSPLGLLLAYASLDEDDCARARIDTAKVTNKVRRDALARAVLHCPLPPGLAALRSFTRAQIDALDQETFDRYAHDVRRYAILSAFGLSIPFSPGAIAAERARRTTKQEPASFNVPSTAATSDEL